MLHHRVVVLVLLAWGPLLLLSVVEGHAWGAGTTLPFLYDVETHARLLIALPLLVVAEVVVHRRLRPAVAQFQLRGLVPDSSRTKFDDAIASAMRLRNSVTAKVVLIAGVYIVGVWGFSGALRSRSTWRAGTAWRHRGNCNRLWPAGGWGV